MTRSRTIIALAAAAGLVAAACTGGGATPSPTAPPTTGPTQSAEPGSPAPERASVRLQLQWATQAQFAGYFAALNEGFYEAEALDVTIVDGGATVIPQQVGSAPDGPEFTISWVPKVLEAREAGSDLVNIAQVFQRSGTLSVSWKDSSITSPRDFAGKKVGVWDFGNEFEVTAAGKKYGLEAGRDYEKIIQDFNMALLLSRQIDVSEAMIYNEYAQVLEVQNPETGELYQPEDLNVIDYNDEGTAMLQDALFARASWLDQEGNEDVAVRFLRASFRGWVFCRENPDPCVEYVLAAGSALGRGHQTWQMNEINALIWPSPDGIGILDDALFDQTVQVSLEAGVIKAEPSTDANRKDLAEAALEGLADLDTKGEGFQKGTVEVTPGGN